jgi:glucose/arabinose dehydrogenase
MGAPILKIDYSGTVSTYATGLRNPYDLVWHTNGQLYVNDNGANAGLGNAPDPTTCGEPGYDPGTQPDELNRVVANKYYGHPNPSRGECLFNGGPNYVPPMYTYGLNTSSDGITEYDGSLIPGYQGNLFTPNRVAGNIIRLQLSANGKQPL